MSVVSYFSVLCSVSVYGHSFLDLPISLTDGHLGCFWFGLFGLFLVLVVYFGGYKPSFLLATSPGVGCLGPRRGIYLALGGACCKTLFRSGCERLHAHLRVHLANLGMVISEMLPVLVGV